MFIARSSAKTLLLFYWSNRFHDDLKSISSSQKKYRNRTDYEQNLLKKGKSLSLQP